MKSNRSKYAHMWEWDDQGHPIDTRYMKGEGYQVSCPDELRDKHAYDLDEWAEQWLKLHRHPVRRSVTAHKRDVGTHLVIMSIDWKTDEQSY